MDLAMTSIDHKFGVAYHFVSSRDGEPEEGNQIKQQYVQDSFVTNLKNMEDLDGHMTKYDMKEQFLVGKMKPGIDPGRVSHVPDLWATQRYNLLTNWDKIDWKTACYWKFSINKRCEGDDKTSNKWVSATTKNSCTAELRESINNKYLPFPP